MVIGRRAKSENVKERRTAHTPLRMGSYTHTHVGTCAYECICNAVDQFSRDSKVANLDLASGIDEDVGGFDVTMDDAMGVVEIGQTVNYCDGHLTANGRWDRSPFLPDGVE